MMPSAVEESNPIAKDAMLAWVKGEFAAANAIIDSLCKHLAELERSVGAGVASEYGSVFAAIHRRRVNWIPVLQMQKYYSISDVALELQKVVEAKKVGSKKDHVVEDLKRDDSHASHITDSCSEQTRPSLEHIEICSDHDNCESRCNQIKMTEGFTATEPVRGQMVNVVKGLKLFENIFTKAELLKLNDFVNELRVAGQNGGLSGETFVLYNQLLKGKKREMIQLGIPIFGHVKEDETNKYQNRHIETIPPPLQGVIEHLIKWQVIPENRKPNGCIINFFDEGEFSQPFTKPPHLEQPISTLLLSESKMAFGRTLVTDSAGDCKGPLVLSLQEGSLLVMGGNSSDTVRHVMCTSSNKRVSITFFKVQTEKKNGIIAMPPLDREVPLWHPGMQMLPKWGILPSPMFMLASTSPIIMSPPSLPLGGTGVFLPWKGSRKSAKHLPPRTHKGRFLSLPSPPETDPGSIADDKSNVVQGG